jgi:predicted lactoylglutathione lyase
MVLPFQRSLIGEYISDVQDLKAAFLYYEGVNFSQKHNYNMAKIMAFIAEQNYMFRPISAIFRFSQLLC